jgi:GNAT superfamily N-acetyltransferase
MEIVPFGDAHIEAAAALFADSIRKSAIKGLITDAKWADGAWKPQIEWLSGEGRGIALIDGGRLAGYMLGLPIDGFMGPVPGIYCPEYGHGVSGSRLYDVLYRAAAREWVEAGYTTHAISMLADDEQAKGSLFWHGFGLHVVDAIMTGMSIPVDNLPENDGIRIRLAEGNDGDALNRQMGKHWAHLEASPVFLNGEEHGDISDWTGRKEHFAVVAEDEAGVCGCMLAKPPDEESSALIQAEGTIGIGGTYVDERLRGRGIARRMLAALLRAAEKRGYSRCAVDFEAGNIEARYFWLKFFTPVSLSLLRRLPAKG